MKVGIQFMMLQYQLTPQGLQQINYQTNHHQIN